MFEKHWLIWVGIVIASLFNILLIIFLFGESLAYRPPQGLTPNETLEFFAVIIGFAGGIVAWFLNKTGAFLLISGGLLFLIIESIDNGVLALTLPFNLFIIAGLFILLGLGLQRGIRKLA